MDAEGCAGQFREHCGKPTSSSIRLSADVMIGTVLDEEQTYVEFSNVGISSYSSMGRHSLLTVHMKDCRKLSTPALGSARAAYWPGG